ncbi:SGNH/GDSL hydrolase family protein [Halalkalibacter kiskunsagensis]|uniref:SGNH/GDSL hydrolase family protein n=1 Tax=Halalkalibacter kiskunsagensis TaxID=1548599 RepID=A0ABV6KI98_9BACI
MRFNEGEKIILIGDSITDSGRRDDPERIGNGYVRLIRDYYLITEPKMQFQIINQGIGGDRVIDLEKRWKEDVLNHKPDWVSISIGINDVWRQLDRPEIDQVYPETFLEAYTKLLSSLKEETSAQVILMEPTIIEESIESAGNKMLAPYVDIVNRLADKYNAILVPTHQEFKEYLQNNPSNNLTTDGVHMNLIGDMLMARTWIKALQER